jgi:hypothetical protein
MRLTVFGANDGTGRDPALANGAVSVIVRPASTIIGVAAITVIDGRITEIDLIIAPSRKLALSTSTTTDRPHRPG